MDYLNFDVALSTLGNGAVQTRVIQSPAGEATGRFRIDDLGVDLHSGRSLIEQIVLRSAGGLRPISRGDFAAIDQLGRASFRSLLSGDVMALYAASRQIAEFEGDGLRLRLRFDDHVLSTVPWEFMFDTVRQEFLALSPATPIIRYVESGHAPDPLRKARPIRILGVICGPRELPELDHGVERVRVDRAVRDLVHQGLVELTWSIDPSAADLQTTLRQDAWNIVHFIGHGSAEVGGGRGVLALTAADGRPEYIDGPSLGRLLAEQQQLHLVVLNACNAGRLHTDDAYSNISLALARRGVGAVVAMQYPVSDWCAIEFSRSFYEALAAGLTIDGATSEARKAISLGVRDTFEWGTPILCMRSGAGAIVAPAEAGDRRSQVPVAEAWRDRNGSYGRALAVLRSGRRHGEPPPVSTALRGRDQDLSAVRASMQRAPGIIILTGPGGIGKSSLAARCCELVRADFARTVWVDLSSPPGVDDFVADLVNQMSGGDESSADRGQGVDRLLQVLADDKHLVVLDNFETAASSTQAAGPELRANSYELLLEAIADSDVSSTVLVTTREVPQSVAGFQSHRMVVHRLAGIDDTSTAALLEDQGVHTSEETASALTDYYDGNPLALELAARVASDVYGGDLDAFLEQGDRIPSGLHQLLDSQIDRLSQVEYDILLLIAASRRPCSARTLAELLLDWTPLRDVEAAILRLERLGLVKLGAASALLVAAVHEFVVEHVCDAVADELRRGELNVLARIPVMSTDADDITRESQMRGVVDGVGRRLDLERDPHGALTMIRRALEQCRASNRLDLSYAPGNLLNIAVRFGIDISENDWSDLTIRQAWLRGADLSETSFERSRFVNCVWSDAHGDVMAVRLSPSSDLVAASTTNNEVRIWSLHRNVALHVMRDPLDWVYDLDFSGDGTRLAGASYDGSVYVWEVDGGGLVAALPVSSRGVRSVAFAGRRDCLATGSDDGFLRLWDLTNRSLIAEQEVSPAWVYSVRASGDGQRLVSAHGDGRVCVWDSNDLELLSTSIDAERTRSAVFGPDSSTVVYGTDGDELVEWHVGNGDRSSFKTSLGRVQSVVAIPPNHESIVAAGDSEDVALVNNESASESTELRHRGAVRTLDVSPDGHIMASGGDDQTIYVWDLEERSLLRSHTGWDTAARSLSFDRPSGSLAAATGGPRVSVFDVRTGTETQIDKASRRTVWSVRYSPNGHYLAVAGDDHSVHLLGATESYRSLAALDHGCPVRSVSFDPSSRYMVTGADDGTIRLIRTGSWTQVASRNQRSGWLRSITFDPNGDVVATAGADGVGLFRADELEETLFIPSGTGWMRAVAFSPDGQSFAYGGADGVVRLRRTDSGELIGESEPLPSGVRSLTFDDRGLQVVAATQTVDVHMIDTHTWQTSRTLRGHHWGGVWDVSFIDADETLATACDDGTIRLWGDADRILRARLPYDGMSITGATGLTDAERSCLIKLGASDG